MSKQPGSVSVGFCILSHDNPRQLLNLVTALNLVYGSPPIVCHHDSSQSKLDRRDFPANVRFTSRTIRTGWGRLSVVRAGLLAIAELLAWSNPDWFVLLSAADYPIAPGNKLLEFLAGAEVDAFIDARPLLIQKPVEVSMIGENSKSLAHFASPGNVRIKSRFYLSPELWIPIIRLRPRPRLGRFTIRLPTVKRSIRRIGINIFYGDHWFMGNRATASALAGETTVKNFLLSHLRARPQADECFYQTLLMNTPGLRVCLDTKRFAEWNGGGAHPMTIVPEQVPEMLGSGSFFARKFAHASSVLKAVDRALETIG